MTIKEFRKLANGAPVRWDEDGVTGYVVRLPKNVRPDPTFPSTAYITWADGERTDGQDDWALKHVRGESK